jgi:hypothetical protein
MNATMNAADVIKANPLMRFAIATYSYTQEHGSDGCWSSTESRTCSLGAWVNGNIHHRHPGNRSYNFTLDSIEEVDQATLLVREAEHKAKKEQERQEADAKRAADAAEVARWKAEIESWVGRSVTMRGGKSGVVEKSMASAYKDNTVAILVRYPDGTKKWHSEGAVKQK